MATFQTLYQRVSSGFSDTVDQKEFTNVGYNRVCSTTVVDQKTGATRRLSFLRATTTLALVANQAEYAITGASPATGIVDWSGPISVAVSTVAGGSAYDDLLWYDEREFDRVLGASTGVLRPLFVTMRGAATPTASSSAVRAGGEQRLVFGPTPDAAYNALVRYYRDVASIQMANDADIPILPLQFHHLIVLAAMSYGSAFADAYLSSVEWEQKYQAELQMLLAWDGAQLAPPSSQPGTPS